MVLRMDLSPQERERVEVEVGRMVAELRLQPTQEKEDAFGLEIARMPAAEREFVSTVLLRMLRSPIGQAK